MTRKVVLVTMPTNTTVFDLKKFKINQNYVIEASAGSTSISTTWNHRRADSVNNSAVHNS